MTFKKIVLANYILLSTLALGAVHPAFADATIPKKDIAGAADSKLLPRYEGSLIVSFEHQQFTDFNLPLSPLEATDKIDSMNNHVFAPKQSKDIEGEFTRLVYLEPENRSPLEVSRNYQDVLTKAGGEVLFQCKGEACGGDEARSSAGGGGTMSLMMHFFYDKNLKDADFSNGKCALTSTITDTRYFSGKMPVDGGDAYLAVQTFTISDGGNFCKEFNNRTIALIQLVAPKARDQKMVVIKADEMAKGIDANGRIALYGILFDTNKADLKPESDPTLQEIAKLLTSTPALNVVIVGHTDNVGNFDYNIDLSKKRAAAVVAALSKNYKIPEARLKSAGVGMVAPTAANASEDGRAKNRRVEIVRIN